MLGGGDEGLVLGKKVLKKSFVLEGPRGFVAQVPQVVLFHVLDGPIEVRTVVGAEAQFGLGQGAGVKKFQKGGPNETPLEVTFFGPRIGKQDHDAAEAKFLGRAFEKLHGIRLEEEEGGEVALAAFFFGLLDSLGHEVEPDAGFLRTSLGVGDEPMPVPATDFQGEAAVSGFFRNFVEACLAKSPDTIPPFLG